MLIRTAVEDPNTVQVITLAVLSSGLVSGLFTLFAKKLWSPESENDLARLGNEFASQLLRDAKVEREELRQTIKDLEESNDVKQSTILRLERLLHEKNQRITELEKQKGEVVRKLKNGEQITLHDLFGDMAPDIPIKMTDNSV